MEETGDPRARLGAQAPAALLLDRDGTLVVDVPYNADPARVEPLPGVDAALGRARAAGLRTAIVTNQRGVALGRISLDQLIAVNARVDALLGPFDTIACCPHDEVDRCRCRKPSGGLVIQAARALGVPATSCVVIGDSWSDVLAARNAGATAILVGGAEPPAGERVRTAGDLAGAVDQVLLQVHR